MVNSLEVIIDTEGKNIPTRKIKKALDFLNKGDCMFLEEKQTGKLKPRIYLGHNDSDILFKSYLTKKGISRTIEGVSTHHFPIEHIERIFRYTLPPKIKENYK